MIQVGSVTEWTFQLTEREQQASQDLLARCVGRLVQPARKRLDGTPRRTAVEEGVALFPFNGFFHEIAESRSPQMNGRDDFWQVMAILADCGSPGRRRCERGSGVVREQSAFGDQRAVESHTPGLSQVVDREPSLKFASRLAGRLEQRLVPITGETMREVALAKLESRKNIDLARGLGLNVRSAERELQLIGRVCEREDIS